MNDYCHQKAVEKCDSEKEKELCINRVFEEIKNQEIVFRLSAVSNCKCDPNTDLTEGQSCSSVANTCANKCIQRACKIRSSLECHTEKDQTTCFQERNLTCTALHTSN